MVGCEETRSPNTRDSRTARIDQIFGVTKPKHSKKLPLIEADCRNVKIATNVKQSAEDYQPSSG